MEKTSCDQIRKVQEWEKKNKEKKRMELAQVSMQAHGEKYETPGISAVIRKVGSASIVLLRNEEDVLPIAPTDRVSLFGRCQVDTFYVGYGSGGDVNPTHRVSILEGLRKGGGISLNEDLARLYEDWCRKNPPDEGYWGNWPLSYPEMPVSMETVSEAADKSDKAIVIIGRAAGEDRDNKLIPGSWFLTDEEKDLLSKVDRAFNKVIVLMNVGNIMDFSWIADYSHIRGLALIWQLGQETGYAVSDVLSGRVSPSGKLPDTVASSIDDYPSTPYFGDPEENAYKEGVFLGYRYFESGHEDKVLFPFGYGMSYTTFKKTLTSFSHVKGMTELQVETENTGKRAGSDTIEVYCSMDFAGKALLPKPDKILAAFGKVRDLKPGEKGGLSLVINDYQLSSYDADGVTGHRSAYVLEKGTYRFWYGEDVRHLTEAGSFTVDETRVVRQAEQAMTLKPAELRERILSRLPKEIPWAGDRGITLKDVHDKKASLDAFIAQLSPYDLSDLTRGEGGLSSPLGTPGNTGAFGGITESLRKKGIPPILTSDGPSGIRLMRYCALLPIGTAMASTWDDELVRSLYKKVAEELKHYKIDVLLAPGMSIHRNPLCGRNFEYYSEDPYLTGWMGAAAVSGIESLGGSACIKHICCNNQETNRNYNNSVVDERTLREIYLRGFEMAVEIAHPKNAMVSYNKVNGVWSHYNYDLVTTIMRKEWGFTGNILTDWWMQYTESPEFPGLRDDAYRIRSGVDVLMPGSRGTEDQSYVHNSAIEESMDLPDGSALTLGELQEAARHVLALALRISF